MVTDDRVLFGRRSGGGKGDGSDVLMHKGWSIIRKNSPSVYSISLVRFRERLLALPKKQRLHAIRQAFCF